VGVSGNQFQVGQEGYMGFQFTKDGGTTTLYGWMRVVFTNNTGGAVIKDWGYDDVGGSINIGRVQQSAAVNGTQSVTLSPATGENFTLGTAITNTNGNVNRLIKTGAGSTTLNVPNTYTGPTDIQGGTLFVSGAGTLPSTTALSLSGPNATLNLASMAAASLSVGSLSGVASSAVELGNKSLSTGSNDTDTTFSGTLSGNGGSLIKQGTGTLTLSGQNIYSSNTNIERGTILLGANNALPSIAALNLSTGTTLNTGSYSATTGSLSVLGVSNIDVGTGSSSQLTFSNVGVWAGILSVWNYNGAPWTPGSDKLIFTSGLANIDLASINFYSGPAGDTASLIGTGGGGLIGHELVPVPEPSAVVGGVLLLAITCWRERKRSVLSGSLVDQDN
jgi:autotransporter-associated beta strand protein